MCRVAAGPRHEQADGAGVRGPGHAAPHQHQGVRLPARRQL